MILPALTGPPLWSWTPSTWSTTTSSGRVCLCSKKESIKVLSCPLAYIERVKTEHESMYSSRYPLSAVVRLTHSGISISRTSPLRTAAGSDLQRRKNSSQQFLLGTELYVTRGCLKNVMGELLF